MGAVAWARDPRLLEGGEPERGSNACVAPGIAVGEQQPERGAGAPPDEGDRDVVGVQTGSVDVDVSAPQGRLIADRRGCGLVPDARVEPEQAGGEAARVGKHGSRRGGIVERERDAIYGLGSGRGARDRPCAHEGEPATAKRGVTTQLRHHSGRRQQREAGVIDRGEARPFDDVTRPEVGQAQQQRGGVGRCGGGGRGDRDERERAGGEREEQAACAAAVQGVRTIFSASRAS